MHGSLGGGMYGVWRPSLWSSFTFDLVGELFSEMERGKFRPWDGVIGELLHL